jgi:hypothetical protein
MSEEWESRKAAEPNPEPDSEPFDSHSGPLDDPEDARFLDPADARRLAVERERGEPFRDDTEKDDTEEGE